MTEATIICTKCGTENRLTESLAAPLLAATRKQFEQQLQQKDQDIAQREQAVRDQQKQLLDAQRAVEAQVAEQVGKQVHAERERIMAEESKKARQAAAAELNSKARELADMHDVLKTRDAKLAEAQQAQAELIKKQRQLDDEKRELELTVEKRVQDSITEARTQAKQEADTIRQQFEQQLAQKDRAVAQREQGLLAKEQQMTEQLKRERERVIVEESQKAKQSVAAELSHKARELNDLQDVLKTRDAKLAEAQQAQAELIKKQRQLDDEKRELELTVEKRVQDSITEARTQAKQEANAVRQQFEQQLAEKDQTMAQREQGLRNKEAQLLEQLKNERLRVIGEESQKAKLAVAAELDNKARELDDLQAVLKVRDAKLAEAQQAQAELIKKQRELDDEKRELELTVEKRVQDGLSDVRSQAKREVEDSIKLKLMEKDQQMASMQQKIEELKQKAEQGSQQLQGEVQELELENMLRLKFPFDSIEPVAKGEFGGDTVQRVISSTGNTGGTILWESKRTKNWSDGWLVKLREDQRNAKADIAVLVSQTLPKGIDTFDVIDGIWITSPRAALPVATILRDSLLQIGLARMSAEGQHSKTEMVYQYLTGPRFRQRVEAIVEAFSTMQEDLDKERKVIMKQWAKRQSQIERVMNATIGMYGDLQGIAGKSLHEIEGLEMKALDLDDSIDDNSR
ncbi:DUF2130 domain-containing protein [Crenothrix polyspora]|uniref:DUF2130 domain-containing protein n=1 Tax=Crenothrix polyspora TaxID=360316 RepID=A0A1R4H9T2_9GAMM|nr:DUF2130 domain-containing protein [Crenothrix polyspora]SJM92781.1 conserved hypothetical protein [Crenothrix polyspora]